MLVVLERGYTMQGKLVSTAFRGSLVYMRGRNGTTGQLEFRAPQSSVDAARSCYVVDWENHDYTNVFGGSTSDAMDKNTLTSRSATFHYGGHYRTDKFAFNRVSRAAGTNATYDSAMADSYGVSVSGMGQPIWPHITNASTDGYKICDYPSAGGFLAGSTTNGLGNSNFYLTNLQLRTAAGYGIGSWIEFRAHSDRINRSYVDFSSPTGSYDRLGNHGETFLA